MKRKKMLMLPLGLLASGLIAAGCGDDDESTTDVTEEVTEQVQSAATEAEATVSSEATEKLETLQTEAQNAVSEATVQTQP